MLVDRFRRRKRMNFALQGGGVHGAFTWGVLDRFLAEDDVDIGWMSGTSAGAVNAVAVAHGLVHGDRELARETLSKIWLDVEKAGVPDLMRMNPFWNSLAKAASASSITNFMSPYTFNPLGFDPLKKILSTHIDFEAVRNHCPVDLLIVATDVQTGRPRVFRRNELEVDVVLASACLPTLHQAVVIDGSAYWDGGFSANPDMLNLIRYSPIRDTMLVQLNPIHQDQLPRTAGEIEDRVSTIAFNQPLMRDLDAITRAQSLRSRGWSGHLGIMRRLNRHHYHFIEASNYVAHLDKESKAVPERAVLQGLFEGGLVEASRWLDDNKRLIGKASSVDWRETHYKKSDLVELPVSIPLQNDLLDIEKTKWSA